MEERLARKQADDDFKKTMDTERDRLAQANYASREVKLDSVIKAEAAGLKPPAPSADDGDTDAADADAENKFDIHLRETLRVVSDALRLSHDSLVWTNGQAPVTAEVSLKKG